MLPKSNRDRPRKSGTFNRFTRAVGAAKGWVGARGPVLWRRIIIFSLIALNSLVLCVLYLGGSQDTLVQQRGDRLLHAVTLIADEIATQLPNDMPARGPSGDGSDELAGLEHLDHLQVGAGSSIWLVDRGGRLLAHRTGLSADSVPRSARSATPVMDSLDRVGVWLTGASRAPITPKTSGEHDEAPRELVDRALAEGPLLHQGDSAPGSAGLLAAAPVGAGISPVAVLVLADASDGLDRLARAERERVLRIFLIAAVISVGLSLTLATKASMPLADPATAAETARDRAPDGRGPSVGGNLMPDLTARPDEIGRSSGSVRGVVAALYQRIESNEQFAADVVHEIKNPLTSLRCAVDTMRTTTRADQRDRLLSVIEHDVRRLDRLVSDISSASRLDRDLVVEDQACFDLLEMLRNLGQYLEPQAINKEVAFITDFPDQPIVITGLEARLAQVFVNLITNAISFCDAGDAIRIWARRRTDRVVVVVEDTGPGIPVATIDKIFERFYSNRPDQEFGNHSGLGLAISKQIVEAHDGVIWSENIQPTEADATSDPLGVRFVVGLSV